MSTSCLVSGRGNPRWNLCGHRCCATEAMPSMCSPPLVCVYRVFIFVCPASVCMLACLHVCMSACLRVFGVVVSIASRVVPVRFLRLRPSGYGSANIRCTFGGARVARGSTSMRLCRAGARLQPENRPATRGGETLECVSRAMIRIRVVPFLRQVPYPCCTLSLMFLDCSGLWRRAGW